jgi:DnaJ-class molecular chaperone
MTCPKCHGRGERIVRLLGGWREEDYWLACPDCQGRGWKRGSAEPLTCDCEEDRERPEIEDEE